MPSLIVEATYENGVLKPDKPLPFKEREKVQITVHSPVERVRATAASLPWNGDIETLDRVILDTEFGVRESP